MPPLIFLFIYPNFSSIHHQFKFILIQYVISSSKGSVLVQKGKYEFKRAIIGQLTSNFNKAMPLYDEKSKI